MAKDSQIEIFSDLPSRVGNLFEKLGIECEWSDEWAKCQDCYKLVRTSPDSYSWTSSYAYIDDCSLSCHECINNAPSDYIESLKGNPDNAVTFDIDLKELGYVLFDDTFETGFHPGQNDDPKDIAKKLWAKKIENFVFKIDTQEQFCTKWSCWVHEDEIDLLNEDNNDE